jgi:hypothetical protein
LSSDASFQFLTLFERLLLNKAFYAAEQNRHYGTNGRSASQEILHRLWTPKFYFRIRKSELLHLVLTQASLASILFLKKKKKLNSMV